MKFKTMLSCILLMFAFSAIGFASYASMHKDSKPQSFECSKITAEAVNVQAVEISYSKAICGLIAYRHAEAIIYNEQPKIKNKETRPNDNSKNRFNHKNYNLAATINKEPRKNFYFGPLLRC